MERCGETLSFGCLSPLSSECVLHAKLAGNEHLQKTAHYGVRKRSNRGGNVVGQVGVGSEASRRKHGQQRAYGATLKAQ
jgi:hypothetical protein